MYSLCSQQFYEKDTIKDRDFLLIDQQLIRQFKLLNFYQTYFQKVKFCAAFVDLFS